jgi:hypothetical protein
MRDEDSGRDAAEGEKAAEKDRRKAAEGGSSEAASEAVSEAVDAATCCFFESVFDDGAGACCFFESVAGAAADFPCFVATAAHGRADHPDLVVLRRFRDRVLRRSLVGRTFVVAYYRLGPYPAALVRRSAAARAVARALVVRPAALLARVLTPR